MISVIVPVLNEVAGIAVCLQCLLDWGDRHLFGLEIIVVDGGSTDGTLEAIRTLPVTLVQSALGRATQMNQGAAIATGEILLFLHSDTVLPPSFRQDIEQILSQPKVIAGAFPLSIDDPRPSLRWIERLVQWRSQYLQLPYGDQGIFLQRSTFQQLGGYAPLPIMEDYELIQRLKQHGQIAIAPHPVITSSRRWQQLGIWRTTWLNQLMILGYHWGVNPQTLRQWYGDRNSVRKHRPTELGVKLSPNP